MIDIFYLFTTALDIFFQKSVQKFKQLQIIQLTNDLSTAKQT